MSSFFIPRTFIATLIKSTLLAVFLIPMASMNASETFLKSAELTENQLYIESDSMEYDDQNLIATYEGNVYGKQTNRELFGDKLVVHYNQDKSVREIEIFGKPAKYNQNQTPEQEAVKASALYIKYLKETQLLELKEEVYLDKIDFQSTSESLTYNLNSGKVRAESSTKSRVMMIINQAN